MKILILVQSVDIDRYPELIAKQNQTWNSVVHPDVTTYFYYPVASGKLGVQGNNIYVAGGTNHMYHFSNTMKAFRDVLSLEWDYIVKTDTSAYIDKRALYDLLLNKPRTNYYGGQAYKERHPSLPDSDFLWGECFVVSRDVVLRLIDTYAIAFNSLMGADDVHVARILKGKVEMDKSLEICRYYESGFIPGYHAYRCKKDTTDSVPFEDELNAMTAIHESISVSNVV